MRTSEVKQKFPWTCPHTGSHAKSLQQWEKNKNLQYSTYLALLVNINPTPVYISDYLKYKQPVCEGRVGKIFKNKGLISTFFIYSFIVFTEAAVTSCSSAQIRKEKITVSQSHYKKKPSTEHNNFIHVMSWLFPAAQSDERFSISKAGENKGKVRHSKA